MPLTTSNLFLSKLYPMSINPVVDFLMRYTIYIRRLLIISQHSAELVQLQSGILKKYIIINKLLFRISDLILLL